MAVVFVCVYSHFIVVIFLYNVGFLVYNTDIEKQLLQETQNEEDT